jgi:prolyl-tRNA synthetase
VLQGARGIEVGHIFQLGLKFSLPLRATFADEHGVEQPLWMGCYGIGVSRLAQAAVEQSHDANGIIWPVAIAPYHVVVVVPNTADPEQMQVAEKLVQELDAAGIETLWDDRDERAGVKFKDADLIGIPYRLTTGRSLKQGKVELAERATGQAVDLPIEAVVATLKERLAAALAVPD